MDPYDSREVQGGREGRNSPHFSRSHPAHSNSSCMHLVCLPSKTVEGFHSDCICNKHKMFLLWEISSVFANSFKCFVPPTWPP